MNRSKTRIFIGGMTCVNCQNKIETALLHTAGIETARVSYQDGTADLVYDPDWITLEEIQQVIRDAGYEVLSEKARNKQKPGRAAHILIVIAVLYALLENSGILNRLISKILVGEVKKIDGQKVQEVRIVYNFVGEISEMTA